MYTRGYYSGDFGASYPYCDTGVAYEHGLAYSVDGCGGGRAPTEGREMAVLARI